MAGSNEMDFIYPRSERFDTTEKIAESFPVAIANISIVGRFFGGKLRFFFLPGWVIAVDPENYKINLLHWNNYIIKWDKILELGIMIDGFSGKAFDKIIEWHKEEMEIYAENAEEFHFEADEKTVVGAVFDGF